MSSLLSLNNKKLEHRALTSYELFLQNSQKSKILDLQGYPDKIMRKIKPFYNYNKHN
jgi:hypothetical protein